MQENKNWELEIYRASLLRVFPLVHTKIGLVGIHFEGYFCYFWDL